MLEPPPPSPPRRIAWAGLGLLAGLVLSTVVTVAVVEAAGYELNVPSGVGSDLGRTAMQVANGELLADGRVPLGLAAVLQVPLWIGLLGAPWLARRRGLRWRRDLGLSMRTADIPIGLAIGVALQLVVIPLLYIPIFELIGHRDLGEVARSVVGGANGWVDVLAAFAMVVVGAPLAEEIFFRGLVHRAMADRFAARGAGGAALALGVSSLIFAAAHFQALQFPALFVVGLVTASLLQVTGRLGPAVWTHIGFNATTVVALVLL